MPQTSTRNDSFIELGEACRFDCMFDERPDDHRRACGPAIDVVGENGGLVVRADLLGWEPEEIKTEAEDNILAILGEPLESKEEKDKYHVRQDRRHGSFSRSLALTAGIDPVGIMAQIRDSVVDVAIPLPNQAKQEAVTITRTAA